MAPAPRPRSAYEPGAELRRRGYEVNHDAADGACQIDETRGPGPCGLAAEVRVGGLRLCGPHEHALLASWRASGAA